MRRKAFDKAITVRSETETLAAPPVQAEKAALEQEPEKVYEGRELELCKKILIVEELSDRAEEAFK